MQYARVVLLLGPRQAGKSTLVEELAARGVVKRAITLDDQLPREAATTDPAGYIAGIETPIAIDEVQRAPDLLLAIKRVVDRDTSPGQFLLTGSANVLTAPRILDALTGRTDIVVLWPLAQGEVEGQTSNFIDMAFDAGPPTIAAAPIGPKAWLERAIRGGFPELWTRPQGKPRESWFDAYVESLTQRDLRDLSDVQKLDEIPRLISALAGQATGVFVNERLSQHVRLSSKTISSYVRLLEIVFMVLRLPAWRPSIAARERLAPKLIFTDTGLLAHLIGANVERAATDPRIMGTLFENFVATEIVKHTTWCAHHVDVHHYRRDRREIDLILERRDGTIVAVEAKAGASLRSSDWRALQEMRNSLGDRFRSGIVLHTGPETVPLGDRLWALPVSALW